MRAADPTHARSARALATAALALAAACSRPEPPPPAPSAAPVGSTIAVDPGWVAPAPDLTRLLAVATPACSLRDTFMVSDGHLTHSYQVLALSLSDAELERRFREAARALGYTATTLPMEPGIGFFDRATGRSASTAVGRVDVMLRDVASERPAARRLAAGFGFDGWSLIEALGGGWTWLVVDRSAGGGVELEVTLPLAPEKRATVDAWARDHGLYPDQDGWARKSRPLPPTSWIALDLKQEPGKLTLRESRGSASGPACEEHPSRKAHEAGGDAGPLSNATDDELLRRMLGK